MSSIFRLIRDPDYFRLSRLKRVKAGTFSAHELTGRELFDLWQAERQVQGPDVLFLTACLVFRESERKQRGVFRLAVARGTPAPTRVKRSHVYLTAVVSEYHPPDGDADQRRGTDRKGTQDMQETLRTITAPLKSRWGYPDQPPPRTYFNLSVGIVTDLNISPDCQQYLIMMLAVGRIDSERRKFIKRELLTRFPDDAGLVLVTMEDCKVTEEFACVSIHEIRGTACIGIANSNGEWLRLEGYKFCQLIESPDKTKELGSLSKKKQDLSDQPLAFNNRSDTTVYAMVKSAAWRLLVHVKDAGIAEFLLDMDQCVLLTAVLRRLRHDEDTYRHWQEKALLTATFDPFAAKGEKR